MENFKLLKIEDSLKNSLEKMKFTKPTPIQAMAIPVALEGKDILGTAQTGTGKTLAFSIPLINKLILDKNAFALVMCPTRELATQVMAAIKSIISDKINIKTALLIGGEAMQKQLRQLGNRSRIIVGTPGRINDHLKRKSLNLSATKYLVLDETDRMLDMGFTPQIELILKFVPKDHQTLLFSATLPQNIVRISERYLNKPQRISTGSTSVPIAKIKQETLQVFKENKYDQLVDQFIARKGSILVFVKTKRGADKMVKRLKEEGHSADAIHGDLRQSKRDRVITSFRKGLKRILIATDVAARGLDIPLIQHVINYDLPQVPEDYVHRIGRTARAGTEGSALTFLTPDDRSMWNEISKLIDPNFKPAPRGARGDSRSGKRGKAPYNKKRKFRDEKKSSYGRSSSSSRDGEKKVSVIKENLVLEINQNHLVMEDLAHHQEMEKKKVLVIKENLVLEINQNHLVMEDLAHHQEMEKKKVLVIKENLVLEINQNHLVMEDLAHHQEMEKKKVLVIKENLVLEINQNHLVMEDLAHHQEMEKKKVLVIKENLVLEINQNHLVMEDLAHHQEMEKKKVLVTRENLVLLKKMTRNQQASQIILNILEKKHLKVHQRVEKKKALV
ncbi:DEAD/DEAH box helicase [Candidatus Pelagibacter sp. Uisw_114]